MMPAVTVSTSPSGAPRRHDRLAHDQVLGRTRQDDGEAARLIGGLHDGEIGQRVPPDDLGRRRSPVGVANGDRTAVRRGRDHVIVGQDVAALADDLAGAGSSRTAARLGGDRHHGREPRGRDRRRLAHGRRCCGRRAGLRRIRRRLADDDADDHTGAQRQDDGEHDDEEPDPPRHERWAPTGGCWVGVGAHDRATRPRAHTRSPLSARSTQDITGQLCGRRELGRVIRWG
jgi:hypothetical protein